MHGRWSAAQHMERGTLSAACMHLMIQVAVTDVRLSAFERHSTALLACSNQPDSMNIHSNEAASMNCEGWQRGKSGEEEMDE